MALNRITGLGMALGTSMLVALACDSGGTTSGNNPFGGQGGSSQQNTGDATTGGASSGNNTKATGGGAITGSTGGKSGGTTGGATSSSASCSATVPTATGTLSVTGGYVTAGTYAGYGYTWTGEKSNATTCVLPKCDTKGCTPAFGATALCGAGVVTADESYNSVVGIGFNLSQTKAGDPEVAVAAGANITVDATFTSGDSFTGNAKARIQIVTDSGDYCVDAGSWSSGVAIPVTDFNKTCWDLNDANAAAFPADGKIKAIDIIIPADSTSDRPFSACLTGFSMD